MKTRIKVYAFCLCLVAILIAGRPINSSAAPKKSSVPANHVPASVKEDAQRLVSVLTKRGFEVMQGYFKLYTQDDCATSYEVMKSCFGNNPAAPYIMYAVPSWPEEFVDPATINAFGLTAEGYSTTFRLDPLEAIVVFGVLPPPAAYFGIQTYEFTREGTFKTNSLPYKFISSRFPAMLDTFFTVVPNNPARLEAFASLSNSNNDEVIQRQSGAVFNQERFFIITSDRFMDNAVRDAISSIQVNDKYIFTEPIPSTMKIGLDEHADDFVTFIRYAMPRDGGGPGSHSDKWKKDLPLIVLRVRDIYSGHLPESYGRPVLDNRTADDEGSLADDLTNLVAEVNKRWGQPCVNADCSDRASEFIDLQSPPIDLVGPLCTRIGMNCMGDTQDTSYQATEYLTLDSGEIYAVAATLGTETGNATYVGLSANESLMVKGIANIDTELLKNTAKSYASKLKHPSKFYLYYFTRDCSGLEALTGGNCFSVTEEMIPPCTDPTGLSCDHLKLIQREYIKKGTERGPDSTLTLNPILIRLKR